MTLQTDTASQVTKLEGRIGVMTELLRQSLSVLETLEPENAAEDELFTDLKDQIKAAIRVKVPATHTTGNQAAVEETDLNSPDWVDSVMGGL